LDAGRRGLVELNLVRRNGLAIDDLLAAEVVTADGELLEVDEKTHAERAARMR
jgi:FAD/FMN-containing dehydrogenase